MSTPTTQDLIAALLEAGDTQPVIARETGISQASISRIASGEQKNSSVSTYNRIAGYAKRRLRRKKTAA